VVIAKSSRVDLERNKCGKLSFDLGAPESHPN
jgi:hypothetical protein